MTTKLSDISKEIEPEMQSYRQYGENACHSFQFSLYLLIKFKRDYNETDHKKIKKDRSS